VPQPGTRFANPALADTYERLAGLGIAGARDAFYRGFVAEAIDAFVRIPVMDTSGTPHAGLLTGADLAAWHTPLEASVTFDFGAYRVAKTAPWGQGPVLLQQLALLAGFDLADSGPADPQLVHVVVECAKLAFADREAFYADVPDVPIADLLDPAYNDERRRLVGPDASGELRPGAPGGRTAELPRAVAGTAAAGVGEPTVQIVPTVASRGDTCHVDVADRFGNLV